VLEVKGKVSSNQCTEILAFYIYLDWRRFLIESWKTNPLDTRWLGSMLFTCPANVECQRVILCVAQPGEPDTDELHLFKVSR